MGLLGDLRGKARQAARDNARKVVEKVASRFNIPVTISREEKDRAEIEAAAAAGAPRFATAAQDWEGGRHHLKRLGSDGLGMIQARWTESELALRQRLGPWSEGLAGRSGVEARVWAQVGEELLASWQARGAEVALAWQRTFSDLDQAWAAAGVAHQDRVAADGWRQAAGDFDRIWQQQWERLQADLQKAARAVRGSFAAARQQLPASAGLLAALDKAGEGIENSVLRAEAELWGVWGTNGALIRGVSRTVTEGRGEPGPTYQEVFARCRADFERGFAHTLSDFNSSWESALDSIARAA